MALFFFTIGLLSGVLGGMLGIGGGVITVPALYFIFQSLNLFSDNTMQIAVATSLAASVITSLVSTYFQIKKKAILFSVFRLLLPGLLLGCILGALLAHHISSEWLKISFGVMAVLLGTYFLFPKLPSLHICDKPNWSLSFFGLLIGSLSSMLGIGGGSLTLPVLLGYALHVKNASATSSLSTLMTTLVGSLTYLGLAWNQPKLADTLGYIDLPIFCILSLGSIIAAPFGVKLSHTLDVSLIKRIFGFSLILVGITLGIVR
jgi:uncharacterized membrane protein YfcA